MEVRLYEAVVFFGGQHIFQQLRRGSDTANTYTQAEEREEERLSDMMPAFAIFHVYHVFTACVQTLHQNHRLGGPASCLETAQLVPLFRPGDKRPAQPHEAAHSYRVRRRQVLVKAFGPDRPNRPPLLPPTQTPRLKSSDDARHVRVDRMSSHLGQIIDFLFTSRPDQSGDVCSALRSSRARALALALGRFGDLFRADRPSMVGTRT
ncbi:hypothetical protein QBC35DRAFT_265963 [Podospora australis]|uniref:Uncharacterized protein n=1 Tax=Podospora australis TaxID=1536484 RepID=A0AAN6WQR9_9PEZI|nr:hypothetical protein QBC35DRAFT_265963 [Podospora australis]